MFKNGHCCETFQIAVCRSIFRNQALEHDQQELYDIEEFSTDESFESTAQNTDIASTSARHSPSVQPAAGEAVNVWARNKPARIQKDIDENPPKQATGRFKSALNLTKHAATTTNFDQNSARGLPLNGATEHCNRTLNQNGQRSQNTSQKTYSFKHKVVSGKSPKVPNTLYSLKDTRNKHAEPEFSDPDENMVATVEDSELMDDMYQGDNFDNRSSKWTNFFSSQSSTSSDYIGLAGKPDMARNRREDIVEAKLRDSRMPDSKDVRAGTKIGMKDAAGTSLCKENISDIQQARKYGQVCLA